MRKSFSIRWFFIVVTLVACAIVIAQANFEIGPVPDLALLLSTELIFLTFVVETMVRQMPTALRETATENGCRIDGSPSRRRERKEQKARLKLRADLWAGLLLAVMAANALLITIHFLVLPLDLATRIVSAMSSQPGSLRDVIQSERIDERYVRWAGGARGESRQEARRSGQLTWHLFPALLVIGIVALVAIAAGIKFTYQRALRDYAAGLEYRQQQNLFRDLARFEDGIEPDRLSRHGY